MTKKNVAIYGLTAEHQDEADKAKKEPYLELLRC